MITAGVDVGTRTVKVVILDTEKGVLASEISPVNDTIKRISKRLIKSSLKKAGVPSRRLARVAATGYGRKNAKVAQSEFPTPLCVAKAINYLDGEVHIVLDIGGLITRAVRIGPEGNLQDYMENEKCASGSGRFLEMIAEILEVPLEQIGPLSLTSTQPLSLSSQCVVFAESEVVSHVNAGEKPAEILAGLHRSIADRAISLAMKLDITPPLVLVGGVAKNTGVVHFIEQTLDIPLRSLPEDPQIIAALGAALLA